MPVLKAPTCPRKRQLRDALFATRLAPGPFFHLQRWPLLIANPAAFSEHPSFSFEEGKVAMAARCSLINLPPALWDETYQSQYDLKQFGRGNAIDAEHCNVPMNLFVTGASGDASVALSAILGQRTDPMQLSLWKLPTDLSLSPAQPLRITISSRPEYGPLTITMSVAQCTGVQGTLPTHCVPTVIGTTHTLDGVNDLLRAAEEASKSMPDVANQFCNLMYLDFQVVHGPTFQISVFPGCQSQWWDDVDGRQLRPFFEQDQGIWIIALSNRPQSKLSNASYMELAGMRGPGGLHTIYTTQDRKHGDGPIAEPHPDVSVITLPRPRDGLWQLAAVAAPNNANALLQNAPGTQYGKQINKFWPFFQRIFKAYQSRISVRQSECRQILRTRLAHMKLLFKRTENPVMSPSMSSGLDNSTENDFEWRCNNPLEGFSGADGMEVVLEALRNSSLLFIPISREASEYLMGTQSHMGDHLNSLRNGSYVIYADELRQSNNSILEAVKAPMAQIEALMDAHLSHLRMMVDNSLARQFNSLFGPSMNDVIHGYIFKPVIEHSFGQTRAMLEYQFSNMWRRIPTQIPHLPDLIAQCNTTAAQCEEAILVSIRTGHESKMLVESDLNTLQSPPTSPILPSESDFDHSLKRLGALSLGDPAYNILWRLRRADYESEVALGARLQISYPAVVEARIQEGVREGLKRWLANLTDEDRHRLQQEYERYERESNGEHDPEFPWRNASDSNVRSLNAIEESLSKVRTVRSEDVWVIHELAKTMQKGLDIRKVPRKRASATGLVLSITLVEILRLLNDSPHENPECVSKTIEPRKGDERNMIMESHVFSEVADA
ncbi:hypothetical protein SISNIDRAFT_469561 [Sistotremastrum niveocremeum HHB9708]|uniref:Uncharacterized protein n=1 Tax=Sistotremastrum niveocremeum HHB9708 TaxID=1314777 RepID=A0A164PUN1_9AGAM|nr:hypothetical protein SISNIDRAFT_469561 [Sistotremastrum niveocremeum HHB9708]